MILMSISAADFNEKFVADADCSSAIAENVSVLYVGVFVTPTKLLDVEESEFENVVATFVGEMFFCVYE